jgi:hypothetical protein
MRNEPAKQDAPGVPLIRLKNLLWMPLLAAGWLAIELYGTPHILITYTYRPVAGARYYLSCDYWGVHSFNLKPVDGECPYVLFARAVRSR